MYFQRFLVQRPFQPASTDNITEIFTKHNAETLIKTMSFINILITIFNKTTYRERIDLDRVTRQQADDFLNSIKKKSIQTANIIIKNLNLFKDTVNDQNENAGNYPELVRTIHNEVSIFLVEFESVEGRFQRTKTDLDEYFQKIATINTRIISKLRKLKIAVTPDQRRRINNLSKQGTRKLGIDIGKNAITDPASLDAAIARAELLFSLRLT